MFVNMSQLNLFVRLHGGAHMWNFLLFGGKFVFGSITAF